uniref:Ovule protein n=1 Tax=Loa loa TaxID=7209 RepID=A0A1I7W1F5_LOALO
MLIIPYNPVWTQHTSIQLNATQPDPNSTQPLATQIDSTQFTLTPTQLNLFQPKTTHAIQLNPNSTQPNTTQHIQFKAAQRILGSRSTILVIFGYWSTSHSTIQKNPPQDSCHIKV